MKWNRSLAVLSVMLFLVASAQAAAATPSSSEVAVRPGRDSYAPSACEERAAAPRAPQGTAYIAATWGDDSVHFLDVNLNDLGSFSTGSNPNGIATDGTHIFVGSFLLPGVYVYDMNGAYLYQWASEGAMNLQGLEFISGALALQSSSVINFLNPADGSFIRSIPSQGSGVEGLTFDGTYLWQLNDDVVATDPATGAFVRSIPNAAVGCSYTGTGLASSGPGELTLACAGGQWYKVSSADGSVLASGNNGLQMYGLKRVQGGVTYDRSFLDDQMRSLLCVNFLTGAYQWVILSGPGAGMAYTGTGKVSNANQKLTSFAGATDFINFTFDKLKKKAQGYFIAGGSGFYSVLVDKNTTDDPAGCAPPRPTSPDLQ